MFKPILEFKIYSHLCSFFVLSDASIAEFLREDFFFCSFYTGNREHVEFNRILQCHAVSRRRTKGDIVVIL